MRIIKKIAIKIFWTICRLILPKKYFDIFFITEFFKSTDLKRLSLRQKIWSFFHGFLPYEYLRYDLANNDYRDYVPSLKDYQKRKLNGSFSSVLTNKILFEQHIKSVINGIDRLHVIENLGFIENGYLHSLQKNIIPGNFSSIILTIEKNGLILKPISGHRGQGIYLIKKDDNHYLLNNKELSWEELITFLKNLNYYLIQENFKQTGLSNEINPGSLNTVRIGIMIDPVTQQPFIAYATHRFGSLQSANLDNVSQGGIAALIDINTGKLGQGVCFTTDGKKEMYEDHPVSLKPIYNEQIPNWGNLMNSLIEMAKRMPYFKYVGWDIVLSNDELFVLEGNVSPGIGLVQIFKPMKEYAPAWRFFQHYKYV